MDTAKLIATTLKTSINNAFGNKEPWQIATITTGLVLSTVWLYELVYYDEEPLTRRTKKKIFKYIKYIPSVKERIDDELKNIKNDFEKDMIKSTGNSDYICELPKTKLSSEDILKTAVETLKLGKFNWKDGRVSGTVYFSDAELVKLIKEIYGLASYTNPLHPDVFPGACKMEAEVVRMCGNLFKGDQDVCGTMTSGGTESILMACKAYRDYGKDVKGVKWPEMVVPITAHTAFDKACQYFKIKMHLIPVDPATCQVDVKAMRKAINGNTIMLVGSAPNYPYGTFDNIEAISDLGLKYNIPVHVDSCLGGFLTAFMEEAGYPVPLCDFRLPGVTSISADTHKYGFAPKGTSLILYRTVEYLHYQYTKSTDWAGGVYGSPTVCGSRAGGAIASCWATLLYFGVDGYVAMTRDIVHTAKYIEKGLRRIRELYIFGQPVTSVVAIGSHVFDIYRLQALLSSKGWNLNVLQFPSALHICVTSLHVKPGVADDFLRDVQEGVDICMQDPQKPVEGRMAIYGYSQGLPDRSIVGDVTNCFLDATYYTPNRANQFEQKTAESTLKQ